MHIIQRVASGLIKDLQVNEQKMRYALELGYPTATDLADWIVTHCHIPFRDAHHITAQIIAIAIENHVV